jgi:hypothetical protein
MGAVRFIRIAFGDKVNFLCFAIVLRQLCVTVLHKRQFVASVLFTQQTSLVLIIEKGAFACYYIDTERETP